MTGPLDDTELERLAGLLQLDPQASPRVRLQAAVALLGARVVLSAGREADGRVLLVEGAPQVWLDRDLKPAHRRFVLAHELAHIVLSDHQRYTHLFPALNVGGAAEEALCDRLALAIMLPFSTVAVVAREPTLDKLRDAARVLEVPVSSVVQRVAQLCSVNLPLLLARRCGGRWVTTRIAGVRAQDGQGVSLDQTDALDRLPMRRTQPVRFRLTDQRGQQWKVAGEARTDGSSTTILLSSLQPWDGPTAAATTSRPRTLQSASTPSSHQGIL